MKYTLYLPSTITKPKQGYLQLTTNQQWMEFQSGTQIVGQSYTIIKPIQKHEIHGPQQKIVPGIKTSFHSSHG